MTTDAPNPVDSWAEWLLDGLMYVVALPLVGTILLCLFVWDLVFKDDGGG